MENLSAPADFERVWARVTAVTQQSPPETLSQELERFIISEQRSIAAYCAILQRVRVSERQTILQILTDERRHLKNLQMEYFMSTGDTFACSESADQNKDGLLSFLRRCTIAETDTAEAYRKASEGRCGDMASMYVSIAADEERHSEMLREMICRCFKERG